MGKLNPGVQADPVDEDDVEAAKFFARLIAAVRREKWVDAELARRELVKLGWIVSPRYRRTPPTGGRVGA
jgi:hypothetical protein